MTNIKNRFLGLALVAVAGCTPSTGKWDGSLPDGGEADAGSQTPSKLFDWDVKPTFTDPILPSAPAAFAAGPGGRIAIAFFVEIAQTYLCDTGLAQATITDQELRLARSSDLGATWQVELVQTVHPADAVALVYSSDGALHLAYTGGEVASKVCVASDLVYRRIVDGSLGSDAVLATGSAGSSNDPNPCRLMQGVCTLGDLVGPYASIGALDDGRVLLAYLDFHYGFSQETDTDGSDLEIVIGDPPLGTGDRRCLDDSSGAGKFNAVFAGQDGRGAVVNWVSESHNFIEQGCLDERPAGVEYSWPEGIRLWQENEDSTWSSWMVGEIAVNQQLAAAYTDNEGYFIFHSAGDRLVAEVSVDGQAFSRQTVDDRGQNGVMPAATVAPDGRIVVAYGRCSTRASGDCTAADDAVMIGVRADGSWHNERVVNDSDAQDRYVLGVGWPADGAGPVVGYRNLTFNRFMVAVGTPR